MEYEVSFHKTCPLSALFYSRILDDGGLWQGGSYCLEVGMVSYYRGEFEKWAFTISFRMLGFVTFGLLFTSTTDLTAFMMSLIHQCRMSPKWAYGMLAGFRFIPLFQSELKQMKAAHKIRGYKQKNSWKAFMRYALPLFTQGVRKSERLAIAMEARGFTGARERTYYHVISTSWIDYMYLLLIGISVLMCMSFF